MRPTAHRRQVQVIVAVILLALAGYTQAFAQKVTTSEELTLTQTFVQLVGPLGSRPAGEAIALATALEIDTAPFGAFSGGFVFKLDPATGLLARSATTFGPAFADRAITSGEGQISVGANFRASTYDKLNDFALDRLPIGSVEAPSPAVARTGTADLAISSKMLVLSGSVGVTDNLDVGVAVPMVSIKLDGISTLRRGDGVVSRLAEGGGTFSGLGDVAALMKYRFVRFGSELVDAGGVAVVMNMHLPTGDRENLRGLDVTRTLVSFVASGRKGRIQPHINAGFEFWSKGVGVLSDFTRNASVTARHQVQYAAGVELEATPKLTLIVDFLGQRILDAGRVDSVTDSVSPNPLGITSVQSLVATGESIQKLTLAPGLKLNLKGKLLLSLNALVTLKNDGLRAKVTPVVGIDLSM
jgi:hypothetical protein